MAGREVVEKLSRRTRKLQADVEAQMEGLVAGRWKRWKKALSKMRLQLCERLKFYCQLRMDIAFRTPQTSQEWPRLMARSSPAVENKSSRSWANARGVVISQAKRFVRLVCS